LQGLAQHTLGRVIVKNAFLGKGHQLQVKHVREFLLYTLHGFHAAQRDEWVDFNVGAHGRAAMPHGKRQGTTGALVYVVYRKGLFQLG
jgi:hypothetical protein